MFHYVCLSILMHAFCLVVIISVCIYMKMYVFKNVRGREKHIKLFFSSTQYIKQLSFFLIFKIMN